MANDNSQNFLSDHETVVDLLYYEAIAKTVIKFVRQDPSTPVTLGVHGDWGAGKSSILKMTEEALKGEPRTLCLWFNGWVFEGFEDAKTVVLETIVAELKRARPASQKVLDAAKKLAKRIQWLKIARKAGGLAFTAATGIPSPDLAKTLFDGLSAFVAKPAEHIKPEDLKTIYEKAGDYLKDVDEKDGVVSEHMHAFRNEFQELLKAAELDQLVILIDDLDRCLPETAIATLEAIRLFLFVPHTKFVIAADETMIEYSVRRHFPDLPVASGSTSYTRNYLEKLIQVPFRIPALGLAETRAYITLLLSQRALGETDPRFYKLLEAAREDLRRPWHSRGLDRLMVKKAIGDSIPPEIEQALKVSAQITRALTHGTHGNPRQIKRFLNSMALRQAIAHERGFSDDIELPVLAKIMLAERFSTDFYEQLATMASASPDGKVLALSKLEATVAPGEDYPNSKSRADQKANPKGTLAISESEEWLKNEWIKEWAAIEPRVGNIDLRPYVFVTRDKRSFFAGAPIVDHLETLVERLMGQALAAQGAIPDIEKLTDPEAEQVFDVLKARVLQSDKLETEPRGVKGIATLVRVKPSLQGRLLQFIRELPTESVGAWAVAGWESSLAGPDVKAGFTRILQDWSQNAKSGSLKAAASMSLKVKAG